jgi:hypothetical protein
MMTIGGAKEAARVWVAETAAEAPGIHGAYFAGSATWLHDDQEHP